jgi:hypothetical protein
MAKDFNKLQKLYGLIAEQQQTSTYLEPQQQPQTDSVSSGSLPEAIKALPKAQSDELLSKILSSIASGDSSQLVQSVSEISGMNNQLSMLPSFSKQNLQQTFNRLFSARPNISDVIEGGIKQSGQTTQQTSTTGQAQVTPQQQINSVVQGTLPKGTGQYLPTK